MNYDYPTAEKSVTFTLFSAAHHSHLKSQSVFGQMGTTYDDATAIS